MDDPILEKVLVVSTRGRITLPAMMRKRLGIRPGDRVSLEEDEVGIVLRPIRDEEEWYSEAQIAEWTAADTLGDEERARLLDALRCGKRGSS